MPGPFPGMDPYLEHPARWPGVHLGLISALRVALNAALPEPYVADAGERLYVVQPDRSIYPDVLVLERPALTTPQRSPSGGVAVASDPPWIVTAEPEEFREPYIEIVMAGEPGRVVTVVEVLSPANKAAGHPGREQYRTKQAELLRSEISLLELDLLRAGEHTVAAPLAKLQTRGNWDYLLGLHRGGGGQEHEVWAVTLRDRLPRIHIPLAGEDPDVTLDFQEVFDRFYDENAYRRRLDYRSEPAPPLAEDDREWADALLRRADVRP